MMMPKQSDITQAILGKLTDGAKQVNVFISDCFHGGDEKAPVKEEKKEMVNTEILELLRKENERATRPILSNKPSIKWDEFLSEKTEETKKRGGYNIANLWKGNQSKKK